MKMRFVKYNKSIDTTPDKELSQGRATQKQIKIRKTKNTMMNKIVKEQVITMNPSGKMIEEVDVESTNRVLNSNLQTCTTIERRAAVAHEEQFKMTGKISTEVMDGSRYPSNIKSRGSVAPFATQTENSHEVINFVPEHHFNQLNQLNFTIGRNMGGMYLNSQTPSRNADGLITA